MVSTFMQIEAKETGAHVRGHDLCPAIGHEGLSHVCQVDEFDSLHHHGTTTNCHEHCDP